MQFIIFECLQAMDLANYSSWTEHNKTDYNTTIVFSLENIYWRYNPRQCLINFLYYADFFCIML